MKALMTVARFCLTTVIMWQTREGAVSKIFAAAGIVFLNILSFLEGRLA